jgi:CheY-like chemotaxis protein
MDRALRILLVEDVETDAQLQVRELRRAGLNFEAKRVQSESAFLAGLSEFAPDIIMSDFSIPGFGGMRALEIARERAASREPLARKPPSSRSGAAPPTMC